MNKILQLAMNKQRKYRPYRIIYIAMFATIFLISSYVYINKNEVKAKNIQQIEIDNLLFSKVENHPFEIKDAIYGIGQLKAMHEISIVNKNDGIVSDVLVYNGATVTKGDILYSMSNPIAYQNLSTQELVLQNLDADIEISHLNNQIEIELLETDIDDVQSSLELATTKLQAEGKLLEHNIISELSYKITQLEESKFSRQLTNLQSRLVSMKRLKAAQLEIKKNIITSENRMLNYYKQAVDDLNVRAPITGTVNNANVLIGTKLPAGTEIAKIIDMTKMEAIINVNQQEAFEIDVGRNVNLKSGSKSCDGRVSRIEPQIKNGLITIVVTLNNVESWHKPDLELEARFDI